ncbi:PAS domain-containing sensor histidine kinase [Pseudodesulfovibrio sediminis]|uniref:histidine kinase n=1 Tax=Pseudodesulfovibrio sediminis TaxID=2810563 RepID=A0ABM7P9Z3_9BACT|nr:PAS domain S-box protein [Pseudodesulfovibrio sediminis]BCS89820.1 hypothetical protein PSDVSF_30620 [Pseudodesulfovibrio sediminis]
MLGRKRRLLILASLMVLLMGAVSAFSSYFLYKTALGEQSKRLHEMVVSQAALITEMGWLTIQLQMAGENMGKNTILSHLSFAHRQFQRESNSGEFTVAKRVGNNIQFLIVNGETVTKGSPLEFMATDADLAQPMNHALKGETGTMIGIDYKGTEVLAAYYPVYLQYDLLGLVAKIDISEIRTPFIRANIIIFLLGLFLTTICLTIFFKVSEPIIQDIRTSEKKYRDLVEGSNTLILRLNKEGNITFANTYARSQLSTENDTLIGMNFKHLTDASTECMLLKDILASFNSDTAHSEMAINKTNGTTGWVSWSFKPITEEGEITELLCLGNDVTSTHQANDARWEVEERFRGIASASPVGIIITDASGSLIYANERMHKLTCTPVSGLAGNGWFNRIDARDRHDIMQKWFSASSKNRKRKEFRINAKDDKQIWVLGQIVELKNTEDDIVGMVLTFTDITALKDAEESRQRLTAAIEQASEIILITDLQTRITYVNPAFETITGFSKEEALGKTPRILQSGEHTKEFYKDLYKTITAGEVWRGRFINTRKDGKRYTIESSIGPVRDANKKIVGYVNVSHDISEQLIVEAQLRQSQKLESIGELAAGIAHEINTPAQYVTTNLQFLEDSFKSYSEMIGRGNEVIQELREMETTPATQHVLELAERAIDEKELSYLDEDIPNALQESVTGLQRISAIVKSVKQLAHPGEVNKSYHNLNTIVRDAATVSTNEWKYVAEINFDLDESLPQIECLKGEIGQVVLNLIVNGSHAIQATQGEDKARGTITLKTYQLDNYAVLEVTDTGMGIPTNILNKVFDPFFTTKEVGKGTGQGLAITYNVVVNMHDGLVDVSTTEGEGTTFTIKLPVDGTA